MIKVNKYSKIYFSIIEKAKKSNRRKTKEDYFEMHHIIPKCIDGTDEKENLITLTAREHYICHWLLIKCIDDKLKYKMIYAFNCMNTLKRKEQKRYINSHGYKFVREQYRINAFTETTKEKMKKSAKLKKPVSTQTRERLSKALKGRKLSEEHKQKLRILQIGRVKSKEELAKISAANKGKTISNAMKEKVRDTRKKINQKLTPEQYNKKYNVGVKRPKLTKNQHLLDGKKI